MKGTAAFTAFDPRENVVQFFFRGLIAWAGTQKLVSCGSA
jgi:hypothetical protein